MQERCLQMKIGSCRGCNIEAIAREKLRFSRNGLAEKQILRLSKEMCPEEVEMQMPRRSRRGSK